MKQPKQEVMEFPGIDLSRLTPDEQKEYEELKSLEAQRKEAPNPDLPIGDISRQNQGQPVADAEYPNLSPNEIEEYKALKGQQEANAGQPQDAGIWDKITNPDLQESAVRGALSGATYGASEPVINYIEAAIEAAQDSNGGPNRGKPIGEIYKQKVAERREQIKRNEDLENYAQMGGIVASNFIPGLNVAGKVGGLVTKGAQSVLGKGVIGSVVGNAAGVGATAIPETIARNKIGELSGMLTPEEQQDSIKQAEEGAAIAAGMSLFGKTVQGIAKGGKTLWGVITKVPEEDIARYLQYPEAVNAAPTMTEAKGALDAFINDLQHKVDIGELSVKDSDEILNAYQKATENKFKQFKDTSKEIYDSKKSELEQTRKAYRLAVNEMRPSEAVVQDVLNIGKGLKNNLLQLSDESEAILAKENVKVPTQNIINKLEEYKNTLYARDRIDPVTGKTKSLRDKEATNPSINAVNYLKDYLKKYGNFVSGEDIKYVLKNFDKSVTNSYRQTGFGEASAIPFKIARDELDLFAKANSPAFRKAMEKTREARAKLETYNKYFNTERVGPGGLENSSLVDIESSIKNNLNRNEVLNHISEWLNETGGKLSKETKNFIEHERRRVNPIAFEDHIQRSSKYKEYLDAKKDVELAKKLNDTEVTYGIVNESNEKKIKKISQERLDHDKKQLEEFADFSKKSSENKIKAMMNATEESRLELQNQFRNLGLFNGTDKEFIEIVKDMGAKASFEKNMNFGSAMQNGWAQSVGGLALISSAVIAGNMSPNVLTTGISALVGGVGGVLLAGKGPKLTKKILDAYMKVNGVINFSKVDKALNDFDPETRGQMLQGLSRALNLEQPITQKPVFVEKHSQMEIIKMIRESRKLTPFEKAEELTRLAQTNHVTKLDKILELDEIRKYHNFGEEPKKRQPFDRKTLLKNIGG